MRSRSLSGFSDVEPLRAFVARLREGVSITTQDGRIVDADPAFLHMFGLRSLADLAEVTAAELRVRPQRREEEMALLAREGAVRGHAERLEQTVKRADRSLIRARQRERGVPAVPPLRRRRAADAG